MELTKQEKLKLIDYFEFQRDNEASKPLDEMNLELIDSYVKILLTLQDKHIELSSEFVNEQVRKLFNQKERDTAPETVKTTKKNINKKKVWLVAACIAILVALFSIVSFSSEKGVVDTLEDFFGTFEFIPFGKEVTVGNESYGKDGSGKIYTSMEDFVKNEKYDLLFPLNMVDDIDDITIVNSIDKNKEIHIVFNTSDLFITVTIDSEISKETIDVCDSKITLNGIDYYLCIMEDINQAQAYFIYDNNMYVIMNTNEKLLMEILNNMEEIKNED